MESLLTAVSDGLARQSLQITAVFALVAAICWGLRKASAHWRYWLWLVVLAKCLAPGWIGVPLAVLPQEPPTRQMPAIDATSVAAMPSPVAAVAAEPELPLAGAGPVDVRATTVAPAAVTPSGVTPSGAWAMKMIPAMDLSWCAWLALAWLAGVALFLTYVSARALATHRRLKRSRRIADHDLQTAVAALAGRLGLKMIPNVYMVDAIAQPFVWGWLRGSIYLPSQFAGSGNHGQRQAILTHELAHVARWDAAVNLVQIVVQGAFFFHPLVWWTNRQIRREREKCCDEIVIAGLEADPKQYGQAIVNAIVSEYEASQPAPSLAVAGRLKNIEERIQTILDSRRKFYCRPSWAAIATVACLAACAVPTALMLTARGGAEELKSQNAPQAVGQLPPTASTSSNTHERPNANAQTAAETKAIHQDGGEAPAIVDEPAIGATVEGQQFELIVLGPDERPVPRATVEIRGRKRLIAEQIQIGQFVKTGNYGADTYSTTAQTDENGRLVFRVPNDLNPMGMHIEQAGYGPYLAWFGSWNHPATIPTRHVVVLDAGWSLGGVLVDPQNSPIQDAKVKVIVKHKTPSSVDNTMQGTSSLVELTSNAQGQWRCDSVPASMDEVFVEINHPTLQPIRRSLARNGFGIPQGAEPAAKIQVPRGIAVVGKVTDETGKPISDATVRAKPLHGLSSTREAKTDDRGQYELVGCAPEAARIMVAAKGRATDMKEVAVGPGMEPVNFVMKRGGRVRVRVQDEKGNPVPKADVRIDQWRNERQFFAFGNVNRQADDTGLWQWDEAPSDEFNVAVSRPDGMSLRSQSLVARDAEYVFQCPPALEISGSVVDAETKQPVKTFRVVSGYRYETNLFWNRQNSYIATDGRYRLRDNLDALAHLIQIEAEGYQVAASRDIKRDEGKVRVDFELKRGSDVSAVVLTPTGQPATGAEIGVGVADSVIGIHNGRIRDTMSAVRYEADAEGRFSFPNQNVPFQLIITHPSGFARVQSVDRAIPDKISLTAWARVEGTFRVGSQTVANVPIAISGTGSSTNGEARFFTDYRTSTGADGRFVFDRVFPGSATIGRSFVIPAEGGADDVASSCWISLQSVAGQTTHVDIGGSGRPVVGRLTPPPGRKEKVLWNYATINARCDLPPLNLPMPPGVATDEQREKWLATEGGKIWQAASDAYERLRSQSFPFLASVAADGSFRIDDVPAGVYTLTVRFAAPETCSLPTYRFTVPPIDGGRSNEPLSIVLEEAKGPLAAPAARR